MHILMFNLLIQCYHSVFLAFLFCISLNHLPAVQEISVDFQMLFSQDLTCWLSIVAENKGKILKNCIFWWKRQCMYTHVQYRCFMLQHTYSYPTKYHDTELCCVRMPDNISWHHDLVVAYILHCPKKVARHPRLSGWLKVLITLGSVNLKWSRSMNKYT